MSYRIHRSMGYGMPWSKFEELCQLPSEGENEDDIIEVLYNLFGSLTHEQLTVPNKLYKELFYQQERPRAPTIFDTSLLKTNVESFGGANDLYQIVMTPDSIDHILFFPSLSYAKKWHRYDDDLDYAFEQWRDSTGEREDQHGPRDFTTYLGYGPHTWSNNLMLADGTPVEWQRFTTVNEHPEWLPAVPSEIRWYLTEYGVLTNDGVNQLRPLIAQWWC